MERGEELDFGFLSHTHTHTHTHIFTHSYPLTHTLQDEAEHKWLVQLTDPRRRAKVYVVEASNEYSSFTSHTTPCKEEDVVCVYF